MEKIKVGVIGYGYWGPNLVRNFSELPSTDLVAIADISNNHLQRACSKYPNIILTNDYREFFNIDLNAAVVATPPDTHFQIAQDCLQHGLNVLVEKPMTRSSEEAGELIELADQNKLTLMVGHTFEYNTAVQTIKNYIDKQELGDIYYIDTARLNLGLFQQHANVMWDLAVHDISILLYLLGQMPISVCAQGVPFVFKDIYDVVHLNLVFPNNTRAYVHVSWLDPCKVRRVTVVGSKKMAVFNDVVNEEKIKIFDKGVEAPGYTNGGFAEFQCNYRYGDITIPNIHYGEPLRQECQHFIESIVNKTTPCSSGLDGLRVVKILEAADRSMMNGSSHEEVSW